MDRPRGPASTATCTKPGALERLPGRALAWAAALGLAACVGRPPPGSYRVAGRTYTPLTSARGYSEVGVASWYGPGFHGRTTSSGEVYDMNASTCAHKLLPLGTVVRVTNLGNGRTSLSRVNDRGPFEGDRIVDLSYGLARELGMAEQGLATVRIEAVAGPEGSAAPGQTLAGPFAWQAGAFRTEESARALAEDLRGEFGDVTVVVGGDGLHRVRVGTYATEQAAQAALARLLARGVTPWLVRKD